jgi:hypothetical protein
MEKENIKFWLPYIGTLIVVLGASKIVIFYMLFHFNISYYLDITEIISLILGNLVFIIGYSSVLAVLIYLAYKAVERLSSIRTRYYFEIKRFIPKRKTSYLIAAIVYILFLIECTMWYVYNFNIYVCILTLIVYSIFAIIICELICDFYLKVNRKKIRILYKYYFLIVCMAIFEIIFSSARSYRLIKYEKGYSGTVIKLVDKTIVSNDKVYFIGKTKNYVFINNEIDSTITVIPMSEIKELKIKTK